MSKFPLFVIITLILACATVANAQSETKQASDQPAETEADANLRKAFIDGKGEGWRALTKADFTKVNSADDTWTWQDDGVLQCTGKPVSVMRTKDKFTNFEMVCEWMHQRGGGNSGIFVWATDDSIKRLTDAGKPGLPHGIEVQVLDLEYGGKNKADWYTSHGDVFPVGAAKMKPFPPVAPNGRRSFPTKETTKGKNEWNHYYIRAINGEVRLWVNGEEVSGGTQCKPATGVLCLESEGSPIQFKNLRIRELP